MKMASNVVLDAGYSPLNNFKVEIIDHHNADFNGTFLLCFWLYLPADSSPFPSILIRQHHPEITDAAPFLVLNENKEMMLYPIHFLHREASSPVDLTPGMEIPTPRTKIEAPLSKWFHIGCNVSNDVIQLYIDGEVAKEARITCTFDKDSLGSLSKVSLIGGNGDGSIEGYVHALEILPLTSSVNDHFVKNPPLQLQLDSSSAMDIEEENDGVWSIVGGKASCRRNFSLDVVLMNAFGHSVNRDMEVVASLTYADNGAPVEKPDDAEAPLLTSDDGIEFASWDRPSKLINGHASFKLKISQLSSKCDNRLFRIKFGVPKMGRRYPFLEAFSRPIRCISRSNNTRLSTMIWKRTTSAMHIPNGTLGLNRGSVEPVNNIVQEAKPSPLSKRIKLGQGNPFVILQPGNSFKQGGQESNYLSGKHNEDVKNLEVRPETYEGMGNSSSDSDSHEATNSCKSSPIDGNPISDLTIFKYCLGTPNEKSQLLKDIASSVSEQDFVDFALQVSQFSGCFHHSNQIRISKRLIEEGTKVWNLVSQNNYHVLWDNMILVLKEHFMKISGCRIRFLAQQDFDVLRRIGGCQESVAQENFEKLWCWLYPVAFALSQNGLNEMWDSRWIEGFVTKEEAESSLQVPGGLQDPGTFVLRFPTSRSWPHPDAGNLVVTYVGSDCAIHHRLLSLDSVYRHDVEEMSKKSLKDMLLEERELSRLGRIARRPQIV